MTNPPTRTSELDMPGLAWILFGHAAFQYLNAAAELGLFELVAAPPGRTREEVGEALGLAPRANDILLQGCTALGLLTKHDGRYRAAPVVSDLMRTPDWKRFKDTVAFEQYIVYEGQVDFTASLRANRNVGLRRVPGNGSDLYRRLGENPRLGSVFFRYMRSWSELANRHLVAALDLAGTRRLLDVGGGDAVNAVALAAANPALRVTVLEIAETAPLTEKRIAEEGLGDRVSVAIGNMHTDPFPAGFDCILFAHQLVIWTLPENTELLRKAYRALPEGGRVVIFNSMSNDDGDGPVVAALDSVYFASLPAEGGMIYAWRQHEECLKVAGFSGFERIDCPGWTPHGIIIAKK